ncbi:hypothetical protein AD44_4210 [Escherichia coli 3-373-03_S4_C3]|jgi:hypothetical protein|uniref:Phosphopantetheinyl transferase n=1 Tax=Shigella dysenteriae WRSd3 TaxID=1401327 RepID=A0A090NIG2_SHIDY|nr:hypothetical protein EcHS_A0756 [Escherichia coli HS]EFI87619.1 hypothetical protein HMPREF9551_03409 [Escherichia coli MS 196-1]EFJ65412.1 hypothetical protein HMPREF9547_03392 [Escherichia coli MS 175-1]EFK89225.1 hypothetical protein HMPREF9543_03972 [Escherichia coli MS 146-1]ESE00539.1 hypothetical protein HMPREF1616_04120 [Escherichia coli 908658]ESU79851.1 hypothetical protein WRSd3_01837 [Shigella dysenteriae WRSd3]KEL21999.1 hypothetical protein AD44_4210 [Escherichia coli 3-373-0
MRRERLIQPTNLCKFNKLQEIRRPDKTRQASHQASVLAY